MFNRPMTLSADRRRTVEAELARHQGAVYDRVEAILESVDAGPIQNRLYELAFETSPELPKRQRRPKIEPTFLTEQVYRSLSTDDERYEPLLEFAICATEYFDMLDDLIDDDIASGSANEVVVVAQALQFLYIQRLHELGHDAVQYWTSQGFALLQAPYMQASLEPAGDRYRQILEQESNLFGFLTGLAAVVEDAEPAVVDRAANLGRSFYTFEHVLLDVEQRETDEDPWNAWALLSTDEIERWLAELQVEYLESLDDLTEERAGLARDLVAVDVQSIVP